MKNKHRLPGIVVLAAVTVFSFASCNRTSSGVANSGGAVFTVANSAQWKGAINTIMSGGDNKTHTINVTEDFSIPGSTVSTFSNLTGITITITGDKKISLDAGSVGNLLRITGGQRVIVQDVDLQGHNANSDYPLIHITSGGSAIMRGSASASGNAGRGVIVGSGTRFAMQDDASVYGNSVTGNGGGVLVDATFIMQGNALVYGNSANITIIGAGRFSGGNGGGVYVSSYTSSSFIMEGNASIYGNTAGGSGGGVYDTGEFLMIGGTVYGSDAEEGYKNTAARGAARFDDSRAAGSESIDTTIKVVGGVKQE